MITPLLGSPSQLAFSAPSTMIQIIIIFTKKQIKYAAIDIDLVHLRPSLGLITKPVDIK